MIQITNAEDKLANTRAIFTLQTLNGFIIIPDEVLTCPKNPEKFDID